MSIKTMSRAWEHSRARGSDLLILLALADWADDRGIAYPSMPILAAKCRMSTRAVQYGIARLVAIKELRVEPKAGPGEANRYYVLRPPPAEKADLSLTGGAKLAPGGGAKLAPGGGAKLAPGGGAKLAPGWCKTCTTPIQNNARAVVPVVSVVSVVSDLRSRERETKPDDQRILSLSFPSGAPTDKAKAAVVDRTAEALRRGATYPLMAWAIISPTAKATTPWARIAEAGEWSAKLLARARDRFGDLDPPFVGRTLSDLMVYRPPGLAGYSPEHPLRRLVAEIRDCRPQVTTWPTAKKASST